MAIVLLTLACVAYFMGAIFLGFLGAIGGERAWVVVLVGLGWPILVPFWIIQDWRRDRGTR